MANSMVPITSVTFAANTSTITFASIPQNFKDLQIVCRAGSTVAATFVAVLNNDSAGNYGFSMYTTDGTNYSATWSTNTTYMRFGWDGYIPTSDSFTSVVHLMDYSATDRQKTALSRNNNPINGVDVFASRWRSNAAITRLDLTAASGAFTAGSTITIYGIEG
jgi:hypothetical protein